MHYLTTLFLIDEVYYLLLFIALVIMVYQTYRAKRIKQLQASLAESMSYLEAFFEVNDTSICIRDKERRLLKWNTHFKDSIEAYSGIEITVGMRVEDYLDSNLVEEFVPQREQLTKAFDGQPQTVEFCLPLKDGSNRYLETRWFPVSLDGVITAVAEVTRDITRRKQYEESLKLSEKRFDAFMENSKEVIFCYEIDPPIPLHLSEDLQLDWIYNHARLVEANQVWADYAGFSSIEELLRQEFDKLIPRSDPRNVETLKQLIQSNYNLYNFKTYEPSPDEGERILLNNLVGDTSSGYVSLCWGTAVDITEQEKAREELKQAEAKYRSVVELANEAIFVTQDKMVKYLNPFAVKLFGYSEEEIKSKAFLEFIHPEDRQKAKSEYQSRVTGDKPVSRYSLRVFTKSGEVKTVVVNSAAAEWEGKPAVLTLITDVSEMRSLEEKLHEQNERVARMDRISIFGQLTGAIAHELNQPLTGILSNAQAADLILSKTGDVPAELQEITKDIISDTKRAGDVIRNLRDLYGEHKGDHKAVDINYIVEQTTVIIKSELIRKKVCMKLECEPSLPEVDGNAAQIQQVLLNLLTNALDAMHSTPENERLIVITTQSDNSLIRVSVTDSGPGIDAEKLGEMFNPLYSWKSGGMGLGLAISDSIIEIHNGRMFAANTIEGGAQVGFEIRVKDVG